MRAVTVVTTALRANTILILCLTLDALDGNSQEKHEFYSTFLKVKKKEKKKKKKLFGARTLKQMTSCNNARRLQRINTPVCGSVWLSAIFG